MNIPPPPEPAFSQWCADHSNPSVLCYQLAHATPWPLHAWVLLHIGVAIFFFLVCYARRAYIGSRFIDELGGYEAAEEVLRKIVEVDACRLAGGLSAHAFTGKDKTQ